MVEAVEALPDFPAFDAFLTRPGPWLAGFDLPFTQSQQFLQNIGWPTEWGPCADFVAGLTRAEFCAMLDKYKEPRQSGDKEHQRLFEKHTGAASPQKLYGVPVAKMFFEAVPRLRQAGLHIPGLCDGDRSRVAVECYPGVAARALIGRQSYKSDSHDSDQLLAARRDLAAALTGPAGQARFGLNVHLPDGIEAGKSADALDAAICAVQAAWAHRHGFTATGMPNFPDPREGWIADPSVIPAAP